MRLRLKSKTVKKLAQKAQKRPRKPPGATDPPWSPENPRPHSREWNELENRKKKEAFLYGYEKRKIVLSVCQEMGLPRRTLYHWLEDDPEFAEKFGEIKKVVTDELADLFFHRAFMGWERPIYGRGPGPNAGTEQVGTERCFDNRAAEFSLRAMDPERFRDRKEITGKDGQPLPVGGAVIILPDNHRDPSPKEGT